MDQKSTATLDTDELKLFPLPIEPVALCAYTDEHYGKHRDYWRSFLKVLLPSLLERDPAEIEELVEHSILRDWIELVEANDPQEGVGSLIRHMSATLSLLLGQPAELGFASFLDCALPTRLHWIPGANRSFKAGEQGYSTHPFTDDEVFIQWFSQLSLIQTDDSFIRTVNIWQDLLDQMPMEHLTSAASRSA
jgi:hypothetical protein